MPIRFLVQHLPCQAKLASGLNFYVLHIAGTVESSVVPADNTISTAKIQSSAVTDAKIASGVSATKLTTGTLPVARVPAGTAIQVVNSASGTNYNTTPDDDYEGHALLYQLSCYNHTIKNW